MRGRNFPAHLWKPIRLADGWCGEVADAGQGVELWRPFLEQLLRDPAQLPGYAALKCSADRRVITAATAPLQYGSAVCRYVRVCGASVLLDRLRGSPARRDMRRTCALATAGIDTPGPLALIERHGRVSESWLITLYFERAVDLDRLVLMELPSLSPRKRRSVKLAAARAVADLFARLERSGWRHRDLKASNVLLNHGDENDEFFEPRAFIVDVEGLRRRRPWNGSAGREGMVRLAASLLGSPGVTRADYARTLRFYLKACGRSESQWRGLYRDLSRAAEQYVRSAKRRKAGKLDGYVGA